MTHMSHAEQMAALEAWLAEHPARPKPWDARQEERVAHVANGGTLRTMPEETVRSRSGRDLVDEVGYVSRDGGFSWSWEPDQ